MHLSPESMGNAIIRNLPGKTGHTLEQWVEIVQREGPPSHKDRVAWLKSAHGLGHVQASVIAGEAGKPAGFVPQTAEHLLEGQYSGPKAALRPIYERLAEAVHALGPDAVLEVRQTYVSLVRQKQFGMVQASTRDRVDLGLVLPEMEPGERLRPAGSFGSGRTTHRIALHSPQEVDEEVLIWLRAAYQQAG